MYELSSTGVERGKSNHLLGSRVPCLSLKARVRHTMHYLEVLTVGTGSKASVMLTWL